MWGAFRSEQSHHFRSISIIFQLNPLGQRKSLIEHNTTNMFNPRLCISSVTALNAVHRLRCAREPLSLSVISVSAQLDVRRGNHMQCINNRSAGFKILTSDRGISTVSKLSHPVPYVDAAKCIGLFKKFNITTKVSKSGKMEKKKLRNFKSFNRWNIHIICIHIVYLDYNRNKYENLLVN